jgi:hypothetical protein
MGSICSMHRSDKNSMQRFGRKIVNGRDRLGKLLVDDRITLKCFLEK